MILVSKSNNDWWEVKCSSSQQGFIPANYVKEVPPKIVKKKVQKKIKKLVEVSPDENGNTLDKKTKHVSQGNEKGMSSNSSDMVLHVVSSVKEALMVFF